MNPVPLLFTAALSLHLALPAAGQDAIGPLPPAAPVSPMQLHRESIERSVPPAAASDRAELRRRLAELKAQRTAAVARLKEARKAFKSGQVELKIKVSHLRAARVEHDRARVETIEKEVAPLRQEVRARRESMIQAFQDVKRLRAETRAAAAALGQADAGKG